MANKKDKSPKEEFKKKAPKAKKPKTPKKEKEQPYTGGANWCGTMARNRRGWGGGGRSGESW